MLLEVNQGVLDSILQWFLKLFVKLFHEFKPLSLNLWLTWQEKVLVDCEQFNTNNLKVVFEGLLLNLKLTFLGSHELTKFVKSSLLDLGKDCRWDDLKLVHNLGVTRLEIVDLLVVLKAVWSALVHECISLGEPVEAPYTGFDKLIELGKVIIEQILLFLVDNLHDAIVVTDN